MSRIGEWLGRGKEDALRRVRARGPARAHRGGALKQVYDPEIPVNIYDLGLIYRLEVGDQGAVTIDMTLTTPGCPVAETFPGMVEYEVGKGRRGEIGGGRDRLGPALESGAHDGGGEAGARPVVAPTPANPHRFALATPAPGLDGPEFGPLVTARPAPTAAGTVQ